MYYQKFLVFLYFEKTLEIINCLGKVRCYMDFLIMSLSGHFTSLHSFVILADTSSMPDEVFDLNVNGVY